MKTFFANTIQSYVGVAIPSGSTCILTLSQDAVSLVGNVIAQTRYVIPIDATGSFSLPIWFTDELNPSGLGYRIQVQVPNVGIVYDQKNVPITGASFNLASFVPGSQGNATGVIVPTFETNGTLNTVQNILNLKNGSNITLTADGLGGVTITGASVPVSSVFGRTGAVVAVSGDYTVSQITGAAPLANPALTGVPTAPTAAALTNTTQLATTAFVTAAVTGTFVYTGALSGIPATCTIGQLAFITDATAGQNIYECTATNVFTQQPIAQAGVVDLLAAGAKFDARLVYPCNLSGGSHGVTSAGKFLASDVGKSIFAFQDVGINALPLTTVSAFNSTSSLTFVGNTNSAGSSCACYIGTDDTAAINAATAAMAANQAVLIPPGNSIVSDQIFSNGPFAVGKGPAAVGGYGKYVSNFYVPWFDFPNKQLIAGGASSTYWHDFSISTARADITSASVTTDLCSFYGNRMERIAVDGWNATHTPSRCIVSNTDSAHMAFVESHNCAIGIDALWKETTIVDCMASSTITGMRVFDRYGSVIGGRFIGGTYGIDAEFQGTPAAWDFFGVETSGGTAGYHGRVNTIGTFVGCYISGDANNQSGISIDAGGSAILIGNTLESDGTGHCIVNAGSVTDGGGNIISNQTTGAGTYLRTGSPPTGVLYGNGASITGVALTAGALVLSSGWGTSNAVTSVAGANSPITFTITNGTAATGASPTITYTFPTPYWEAPLWVTATQIDGTNPTGTFAVSSLTATGCVLTYSLTPTANDTETIQLVVNGGTAQAAASAPVTSVFGRTGVITAQSGDYSVAQVTGAASLASPTFTGTVGAAAITATGTITATGAGGLVAGANSGSVGVLTLFGNTSGSSTLTAPAVAGTASNAILISNGINIPTGTSLSWNNDTFLSRSSANTITLGSAVGNTSGSLYCTGGIQGGTLIATGATPVGGGSELGIGQTVGFGNGSAGTAVTTTTKGTGSGPTTPQTVVKYLEISLSGVMYWIPLVQ